MRCNKKCGATNIMCLVTSSHHVVYTARPRVRSSPASQQLEEALHHFHFGELACCRHRTRNSFSSAPRCCRSLTTLWYFFSQIWFRLDLDKALVRHPHPKQPFRRTSSPTRVSVAIISRLVREKTRVENVSRDRSCHEIDSPCVQTTPMCADYTFAVNTAQTSTRSLY